MTHTALFWFAWNYLKSSLKTAPISSMIKLSFIALSISSFSISLIISIMLGFEEATRTTLQSINPPVSISHYGKELNINALTECITNEFPEVISISPTAYQQGLVRNHDTSPAEFITIKAINPAQEQTTTTLVKHIKSKRTLPQVIFNNHVVIGYKLAKNLRINPGQSIELIYSPDLETQRNKLLLETTTMVVSDVVKTGIDDIDRNFVFMDLSYFQNLFQSGATILGVKLSDTAHTSQIVTKLRDRLHLDVYTWDELYKPLMEALQLERYAMMLILFLVVLLSTMCTISVLYAMIRHKRTDIALFKAMGMRTHNAKSLFMYSGLLITISAALTGLSAAYGAGKLLQNCSWFTLPDIYYTSHIPLYTSWSISLTIFIAIITLSFIVLRIPLRSIKTVSISEILRFER